MYTLAKRDFVLQKDYNNFQIFLSDTKQLQIKCDFTESEHSKPFSNIINLFLPFGCTAIFGSTRVEAIKPVYGRNIKIKVTDLAYAVQMPTTFKSHLEKLEREANASLTHAEQVLGDFKDLIVNTSFHSHATGIATIVIVTILGILFCFCFWYCIYLHYCDCFCSDLFKRNQPPQERAEGEEGVALQQQQQQRHSNHQYSQ